ncbi:hypothetical protein GIB67_001037 [Kingdonia uniflora]|uniref:Tyrosinase copper-binding domain-containing protein n=1 Tax=Kingdonia uniflora TaxID=39325 RepID=A0A7J7MGC1_9MAGN|nr:hypothetical protein GIB67_001037 [Kingdonia uniflora]
MSLSLLHNANIISTNPNPLRTLRTPSSISQSFASKRLGITHISCEQKQQDSVTTDGTIDRRNVLIGLGGLYGAASSVATGANMASAIPVGPPDLTKCQPATDAETKLHVNCCPPTYASYDIFDFKPPPQNSQLRVRPPAHKYNSEQLAKFKEAVRLMKALPDDDPWSYKNQATIHCTYCNGAFNQAGSNVLLQVHGSWLFLPWHRYYLYFWEKILGKLINDPNFAVPYWNFDNPEAMSMPTMYLDPTSSIYDDLRNHDHYSALLDLNYAYTDKGNPTAEETAKIIEANQSTMHKVFEATTNNPELFMGKPILAGEAVNETSFGSLENLHNTLHMWSGSTVSPYHNMGNFYTAARDTLFFGVHGNVDRLWDYYSRNRDYKVEFNQEDWLQASFVFYDENHKLVKCKVKDCLTPQSLGYTYSVEKQDNARVHRKYLKRRKAEKSKTRSQTLSQVSAFGTKARALDSTIRVLVPRPKVSRTKVDKEDATEIVIIDDIQMEHSKPSRFDVYLAKPIEGLVSSDLGELVGSFVNVAHTHTHTGSGTEAKMVLQLGITSLIDDIEAEHSTKLVVSLVPRLGELTVGGVSIILLATQD